MTREFWRAIQKMCRSNAGCKWGAVGFLIWCMSKINRVVPFFANEDHKMAFDRIISCTFVLPNCGKVNFYTREAFENDNR